MNAVTGAIGACSPEIMSGPGVFIVQHIRSVLPLKKKKKIKIKTLALWMGGWDGLGTLMKYHLM